MEVKPKDPILEYGVKNPQIIDLISFDQKQKEVVLVMVEERDWLTDSKQLHQLEEKINRYLGYVLDGFLGQQYPQYKGLPLRLQIECKQKPDPQTTHFLDKLKAYLKSEKISFRLKVLSEQELLQYQQNFLNFKKEVN